MSGTDNNRRISVWWSLSPYTSCRTNQDSSWLTCSPAPQHLRRYLNMSQRQGDGAKGCHAYDLSKWFQNKFEYPNETYHMFTDIHSLACPKRELRDEKKCTRFDRVAGTSRTRKYTSNDHKKNVRIGLNLYNQGPAWSHCGYSQNICFHFFFVSYELKARKILKKIHIQI